MAIYLPDAIVEEILVRLPVKSLLRFRCVSISWLSLITSTDFVNLQLEQSIAQNFHRLIVRNRNCTLESVDCEKWSSIPRLLNPPYISLGFKILGSSNGLICMCDNGYRNFYLWNPCTNEYKTLPHLRYSDISKVARYGFGYDLTTNDYKLLIATTYIWTGGDDMVFDFSLKRGTWRCFGDKEYFKHRGTDYGWESRGVFSNGALHWTCTRYTTNGQLHPVIVSFVLADEEFKTIPIPNLEIDYPKECRVGVLDGYLCFSVPTYYGCQSRIMKEYGVGSSWTKLTGNGFIGCGFPFYICSPLCFTRRGRIVLRSNTGLGLVYLDRKMDSLKVVSHCSDAVVYVETLISPNKLYEPQQKQTNADFRSKLLNQSSMEDEHLC